MDKLKQYSNMNPLEKYKRMARCITRIVQPIPKTATEPKPGWTTCPAQNCDSIFTRERDLKRHQCESHRDPTGYNCLHRPSTYKRQHTLNLHIRRYHPYSLLKKMDSSTQTVLYKESEMRIISPLEISMGFIDPSNNSVTGNPGSSNLRLMETDLIKVSKKHEADKIKIRKTCEFKRKNIKSQQIKSVMSKQPLDTLPPPEKVIELKKDNFLASIFALDENTASKEGPKRPTLLDMPTFDLNYFNTIQSTNNIITADIPKTPQEPGTIATNSDYMLDRHDSNIVSIVAINNSHSSSSSSTSIDTAANLLQDTILRGDLAVSPSSSSESLEEINIDYLSPPKTDDEFDKLMIELNS